MFGLHPREAGREESLLIRVLTGIKNYIYYEDDIDVRVETEECQ